MLSVNEDGQNGQEGRMREEEKQEKEGRGHRGDGQTTGQKPKCIETKGRGNIYLSLNFE